MTGKTRIDEQLENKRKKAIGKHQKDIIDTIGQHITKYSIKIFWVVLMLFILLIVAFVIYGVYCYFHIDATKSERYNDFKAWFLFLVGCFTRFFKINQKDNDL